VAEVYGRIIISEQFVPLEEKTIRPQTNIGTAIPFFFPFFFPFRLLNLTRSSTNDHTASQEELLEEANIFVRVSCSSSPLM